MLSENVYQDLFLRAGEYLLDEQLISGQKMSKFAFFSLEQHFAPYSGYWSQREKKEEVVSNELCWISNDLRCAESNLYQFGFLKVHVRQLYFQLLTSIGQNILKE
jgi:hypothetical protein